MALYCRSSDQPFPMNISRSKHMTLVYRQDEKVEHSTTGAVYGMFEVLTPLPIRTSNFWPRETSSQVALNEV